MKLPFPPTPVSLLNSTLSRLMRQVAFRHPSILRRMGNHANSTICLDVKELPLLLKMEPARQILSVHRRTLKQRADATIRGKLAAFLAMVHGKADGDALFFSNEIEIEGDTGVVLALRNALDDAELDLAEEIAMLAGPAAPMLRDAIGLLSRKSGLPLVRTS